MARWSALRPYIAGAIVAVAVAASLVLLRGRGQQETLITIEPLPDGQTVTVFVGGEVARPGVYTLPRGDRVDAAIAAAGGLSADADPDQPNRALKLRDEGQIIVPRKGAPTQPARPISQGGAGNSTPAPPGSAAAPGTGAPGGGSPAEQLPINVNAASTTQLERLPGIGPRLAQAIVDYRAANGPFATPADLAKVRGVSEKMVESWANLITFGP